MAQGAEQLLIRQHPYPGDEVLGLPEALGGHPTNRFKGYANPSQPPVKLLAVRPGPLAIYRGWQFREAVPEWPASREPLEVPYVADDGYRYNAADEWASVWEIREQLQHAKPNLGNSREGA